MPFLPGLLRSHFPHLGKRRLLLISIELPLLRLMNNLLMNSNECTRDQKSSMIAAKPGMGPIMEFDVAVEPPG